MRCLITLLFVLNTAQATELAQPVPPEFIRTQLIQAQGATPDLAIHAAHAEALRRAVPPPEVTQPVQVTNHAIALLIKRQDHYYTETWVTVRTRN